VVSELGKRFHVRLHRRGLVGQLSSGGGTATDVLLEVLDKAGTPGALFDDAQTRSWPSRRSTIAGRHCGPAKTAAISLLTD
jgi:hypothetical protein